MKRYKQFIIYGLILLTAVVVAVLFDRQSYPPRTEPTEITTSDSPNEPRQNTQEQEYPVQVFFSKKPDSDNDPNKVFAVNRIASDAGTGKFAVTELLKGPSETEKAQGYFTTVRLRAGESSCDNQDFSLKVENSVATLQFCRQFDHLGVVADGQADSSIKATLQQFDTVKKVVILNQQGNCEFDLSGMNLCKQ